MSVTVHVPAALRSLADEAERIEVEPTEPTLTSALQALFSTHPALRDRLVTEQWQLRPHVAVFVGSDNIRWTGGLDTRVEEGSEITIVPAVSGG